jgi:mRNA-degrading endonuclease RelE of RelBE toxin-antitoxin system
MRLEITEPAEKDLSNLDKKTQKRIKTTLERLITHPQAVDLKKTPG